MVSPTRIAFGLSPEQELSRNKAPVMADNIKIQVPVFMKVYSPVL
jgi:hypothetical protein